LTLDGARSSAQGNREAAMLKWALIFLVVALATGMLGFTGIAGAAIGIAKILFYVFVVLFLVSMVMHLLRARPT
jgi:uncharacterized membrane protein YtjA (UPF0391 family)